MQDAKDVSKKLLNVDDLIAIASIPTPRALRHHGDDG